MMPLELLRFAWRALWGHRLRSGLSLLGMAVGVGAVVLLTALGEGAREYVSGQFTSLGTNILIIVPGKTETTGVMPGMGGAPNDLTLDDFEALLKRLRQIDRGAPVAMATGTITHRERRRQVAVVGTTPEFLEIRKLSLGRGQFLPDSDLKRGGAVAVIGERVARELFPGESPLGKVIRIDDWRMRVVGVLASRGTQLGLDVDDIVVIPVATAMRIFNRASLFRILLESRTHTGLAATAERVTAILAERHGEEDVTVISQDSVVSTLSDILDTLTLVLVAIASISLSVAGIGIMNVMLVSVSERRSEVGLLKAVGVSRSQIVAAFMTEAALLSIAGAFLGVGTGWLAVGVVVGLYPALPAHPPAWAVAAAMGVALLVGIAFGVMPARRASKLDPILALARR
ncbi:MAG TPA: ABC transporter permease [Vicinamibacteria bacterium]|nr:ABC transporter permease [Vicinamibacteria bacterium]